MASHSKPTVAYHLRGHSSNTKNHGTGDTPSAKPQVNDIKKTPCSNQTSSAHLRKKKKKTHLNTPQTNTQQSSASSEAGPQKKVQECSVLCLPGCSTRVCIGPCVVLARERSAMRAGLHEVTLSGGARFTKISGGPDCSVVRKWRVGTARRQRAAMEGAASAQAKGHGKDAHLPNYLARMAGQDVFGRSPRVRVTAGTSQRPKGACCTSGQNHPSVVPQMDQSSFVCWSE